MIYILIQSLQWRMQYHVFFQDRPCISPCIKSISNELDITFIHATVRSVCLLWHHQQSIVTSSTKRKSSEWDTVRRSLFISSFMDSFCHVRNKIIYVLSWWTVYALTWVLFWCLFPLLLCNSENKHQITLSWAHKQSTTKVHTLFYIYIYIYWTML